MVNHAPEFDSTPIARPYFVVLPYRRDGRYTKDQIANAPRVMAAENPSDLSGLVPGTLVLGQDGTHWRAGADGVPVNTALASDAELAAIAALTSSANKIIRFTGAGTAELLDLTAAGAALLDDASAAAQLTTLGVSAFIQTLLNDAAPSNARDTLGLGVADSPTFADLHLSGKLIAQGASVLVDAEHVDLGANYLLLNQGYTTGVPQRAGFVANFLPTATVDNTVGAGVVTPGVDGASDPTITTAGAATFAATDIVMISGSANDGENDGLYEVLSHAANLLTLKSTGNGVSNRVEDFTLDQLVANAGDVGMSITKVTVSVLRIGTDGLWEVAAGSQTGLVFFDIPTAAQVTALAGERIDGEIQIPLLGGLADGGTWTKAISSGGLVTVTRTAADAPDSFWSEVVVPARYSGGKGVKPTGLLVNYTVAGADVADVRFELWKVTQGVDGAARTAAVIFGDQDADYDSAHDTAVKRGDDTLNPELHQCTVTDLAGAAYLADGETLLLRCYVDGDAGPAGVVVVTNAILLFSYIMVDAV